MSETSTRVLAVYGGETVAPTPSSDLALTLAREVGALEAQLAAVTDERNALRSALTDSQEAAVGSMRGRIAGLEARLAEAERINAAYESDWQRLGVAVQATDDYGEGTVTQACDELAALRARLLLFADYVCEGCGCAPVGTSHPYLCGDCDLATPPRRAHYRETELLGACVSVGLRALCGRRILEGL